MSRDQSLTNRCRGVAWGCRRDMSYGRQFSRARRVEIRPRACRSVLITVFVAAAVSACGSQGRLQSTAVTSSSGTSPILRCTAARPCATPPITTADVRQAGHVLLIRCQGETRVRKFRMNTHAARSGGDLALSRSSGAVKRALRACPRYSSYRGEASRILPKPGWARAILRQRAYARYVACMRAHGVADMPDPPFSRRGLAAFARASRVAETRPGYNTATMLCARWLQMST